MAHERALASPAAVRPARDGSCSCDVLATLAVRDPVRALLGSLGISANAISAARARVHEEHGGEPSGWRSRAAASTQGDLAQLLAIVRSADSHAYRVLELLGASCTALRRQLVAPDAAATARTGIARPRPTPTRERRPVREPTRARMPEIEPSPVAPAERASEPTVQPLAQSTASPRRAPPRPRAIEPSQLPPLHGREREISRLADALGRRSPRVLLLVGAHGSGRTLLACHLASALDRPVFRLDATAYEDGDMLAEDLAAIHDEGGIAVLDDLDRVVGETAPPFLPTLAHAWVSHKPPVVTVISPESHGRLAAWMPALATAADALVMPALEGTAAAQAVAAAAPAILAEHGVTLSSEIRLPEIARMADRYLTGLAMPARALDLLDLACARTVRSGGGHVARATVVEIVAERSGLPAERIELRGDQDVLDLEQRLAQRVVGHGAVLRAVAQLVKRNRAGFGGGRPIASVLLLGPSGVGKTELAKALAAALYDREDALVRLDMSEYSEPHAVARIVGAPPGYVGHEQGGALTDPLLARPHCVVLLDEIEKAHRDVHQLLLQVLDEGRLTDGRGRSIDFRHAAVLMTSNLGAELAAAGGEMEAAVLAAARAAFPVELWNRIEAPLTMRALGRDDMAKICRRLARVSSDRLFRERGIRYALTPTACDQLVALAGRDAALGARPLRHLLARDVEAVIADAVLRGRLRAGMQALVDVEAAKIVLR